MKKALLISLILVFSLGFLSVSFKTPAFAQPVDDGGPVGDGSTTTNTSINLPNALKSNETFSNIINFILNCLTTKT